MGPCIYRGNRPGWVWKPTGFETRGNVAPKAQAIPLGMASEELTLKQIKATGMFLWASHDIIDGVTWGPYKWP